MGHVRKRGTAWYVQYRDADGRTRRKATAATSKALALRVLRDYEEAAERARLHGLPSAAAVLTPPDSKTIRQFVPEYMGHVRAHCVPRCAGQYGQMLDQHILPALGALTLRGCGVGDVQRWIDARLASGAAPATVRYNAAVLSGVFREAIRRGLTDKNPVAGTRKPRTEETIERFLTPEEEVRLLDHAPDHLRPLVVAAIYSGMRRGELLGLTWDDVLLEPGKIVVRHTKSRRDRVVPMCDTLRRLMLGLWQARRGRYVFTTPGTDLPYAFDFKSAWGSLVRRADLHGVRFHDLRHTFASRLAQRGVPLQAIQALLGHSTIRMTTRYAHLAPSSTADAVRALDRENGEEQRVQSRVQAREFASDNAVAS